MEVSSGAQRLARLLPALRHRNYRLFLGGQSISLVGLWMQQIAQAWLFFELTGSAAMLGVLAIVQQCPLLFVGPLTGALADRHDRRRILLCTQAIAAVLALVFAGLAFSGLIQSWHVVALAFALGMVSAVDIPARQALIEELVGRQDLPNAIALNSANFNGARLVGPAIAGAVIAAFGVGVCFLGNSVSYLAVIGGLLAMRLPPRERSSRPARSLADDAREGIAFVTGDRRAAILLGLLALVALAGMPYSLLLPAYAQRELAGGATIFGLLMGAAGAGALAGALVLVARTKAPTFAQILTSCLVFGGGLVGLSLVGRAEGAAVALFFMGAGLLTITASTNTLLQIMAPHELRGRIMAFYSAIVLGVPPLGALVSGTISDRLGERLVLRIGGVIVVLVATAAWTLVRSLRRRDRDQRDREEPLRPAA